MAPTRAQLSKGADDPADGAESKPHRSQDRILPNLRALSELSGTGGQCRQLSVTRIFDEHCLRDRLGPFVIARGLSEPASA